MWLSRKRGEWWFFIGWFVFEFGNVLSAFLFVHWESEKDGESVCIKWRERERERERIKGRTSSIKGRKENKEERRERNKEKRRERNKKKKRES